MGFLSRFEGKMEDTLEGAADRMFDSPISPVQIAKKAEKQMRREKMVGAGKQYAPTLYTVLVNPDDDQRLFGYYPTLAGETETYLAAKAAHEGLVMDGQPLVRFIIDDGLKRGKFDVVAEAVAAPIISQLRNEEMQRYGLGAPGAPSPAYGAGAAAFEAANAGYAASVAAPVQPYDYGRPTPQEQAHHGYEASAYVEPAYEEAIPAPTYPDPALQPYHDIDAGFDESNVNAGFEDFSVSAATFTEQSFDQKPPLPYIPEGEVDYSIDYGEYTFDSQNFDDYRQNGRSQEVALPGAGMNAAANAAGVAAAGMAGAASYATPVASAAGQVANGARVAADTVVFAAGAAAANAVPERSAVRARLIDTVNNRTYSLATARLLMGRDASNDITVQDINASRTHAELRLEPQGVWTITDLGSTNGTLVNDFEIATQPLREGDCITIGITNFIFTQA